MVADHAGIIDAGQVPMGEIRDLPREPVSRIGGPERGEAEALQHRDIDRG